MRQQTKPSSQVLADLMTERELAQSIGTACRVKGLLSYFTLDSRGSPEGFPDRVVVLGDTLLCWELKTEKGKPTQAQIRWLEALSKVRRVDARIVRPAELDWALDVLFGKKTP